MVEAAPNEEAGEVEHCDDCGRELNEYGTCRSCAAFADHVDAQIDSESDIGGEG